ncbi:MAG TPA: S-methyl-5-thioribose-1-phosphate isomerase [Acidimicrobiales bacterium]
MVWNSDAMAEVPARTIWWDGDDVAVIDQTRLPHALDVVRWRTLDDAAHGIATMQVRGAPLIGVAVAHGVALAMRHDPSDLARACAVLKATRPTAVNLAWALERVQAALAGVAPSDRWPTARALASTIADEDVESCRAIGLAGLPLLQEIHERTGQPVQVLTHCNAGWLACVEWGTVLAPVYMAHQRGIPVHVWVSETRPRNQGASLTAWELGHGGVPHTLVVDNAAAHLMRSGLVDVVILGADRIAANGDVANKIGTALKAYAAHACGIPFYSAAPQSTFDAACPDGDAIPIEEREPDEVLYVSGFPIAPPGTPARNWGFDVTPARYFTGYITDIGLVGPLELGRVFGA